MDSVTQAVLGATIGVAMVGRRIGPRKAALLGAALGTVPDLDVIISHGDPVSDYVLHRGPTHSLIVQAAVTPLFAEPLVRFLRGLRNGRWTTYMMVYLVFATHALVDAMTIYGTKLLWPLTDFPFGLGSMFIIDPIYSLPLVGIALCALFYGRFSGRLHRWTVGALIVSTLYMGWSAVGQTITTSRAETVLQARGISPERMFATPTVFNTIFWRVVAVDGDRYLNMYIPLFGYTADLPVYAHNRGKDFSFCLEANPAAQKIVKFSRGFVRFKRIDGELRTGDLRMGLEPSYVFDFAVARWDGVGFTPIQPRQIESEIGSDGDIDWLFSGLRGESLERPSEVAYLIPPADAETQVAQSVRAQC